MSKTTLSERLFGDLCAQAGVPCARVPVGVTRSPDFVIVVGGVEVICEVKQIDPNADDQRELAELRATGRAGRFVPNRLRGKLKDVSAQLKAAAKAGKPTLLVVYDNTPFKLYSDHDDAVQAMFGRESVTVLVPYDPNEATHVSAPFFGGDRGLGPERNTAVSAIAMLDGGPERATALRVYHNPYARVRLRPTLLAALPVSQRVLPASDSVGH